MKRTDKAAFERPEPPKSKPAAGVTKKPPDPPIALLCYNPATPESVVDRELEWRKVMASKPPPTSGVTAKQVSKEKLEKKLTPMATASKLMSHGANNKEPPKVDNPAKASHEIKIQLPRKEPTEVTRKTDLGRPPEYTVKGMLMTVKAPVILNEKQWILALSFLDSGALRNFVSKEFAKRAGLKAIRRQSVALIPKLHILMLIFIKFSSDSKTTDLWQWK
jgi:hypothetical protein